MPTQSDNGGPAFPQHGWSSNPEVLDRMQGQQGISLRDYFAAIALQGIIAHDGCEIGLLEKFAAGAQVTDAKTAYAYADAMIDQRKRAT